MSDPQEPIKLLAIPARGSDLGTWDVPVNNDFTAIGAMLGGFTTVSLTNAPVTLTAPSGSVTPGGGPTQIQNSLIVFTGMLTGNCTITFPLPGQYNILNNCVVGAFYVQLSGGSGNKIGIPPGQSVSVFSNGTDMQFISLPTPGTYWDFAGSAIPAWITACSVLPWLVCDGSTPLIATYPQLAAILGTTFGGNGINTFGVPDLRNRSRFMLDTNQGGFSNRITNAGSGINGQATGAAGGDEALQSHSHIATVTDPGHSHPQDPNTIINRSGSTNPIAGGALVATQGTTGTAVTNITVTNANTGAGASQNMPPALIAGLTFIKT